MGVILCLTPSVRPKMGRGVVVLYDFLAPWFSSMLGLLISRDIQMLSQSIIIIIVQSELFVISAPFCLYFFLLACLQAVVYHTKIASHYICCVTILSPVEFARPTTRK
jgi:hypothetical protein